MNITKDYLTPNKYSRPQSRMGKVKGIVIHWVANPKTSAKANRNFFENRKLGKTGYGSAHYIIGLEGEVIQSIPNNEIAYAVGSSTYTSEAKRRLGSNPNDATISIETCHVDWEGHYTDSTYRSMVNLTAMLLKEFNLTKNDVWTHQEIVGWKDCPRLFYKEPSRYTKFKNDVEQKMNNNIPITDTNANTYQIQVGDTLWSIARKFDTTVSNLKKLNPNVDPRTLTIGELIKVKGTSTNPTKVPSAEKPSTEKYPLPVGVHGYNTRGENVKKIQRALNAVNFLVGEVDGVYGNQTRNAVYRFQSMFKHLTTDGIYGNATQKQLRAELDKKFRK